MELSHVDRRHVCGTVTNPDQSSTKQLLHQPVVRPPQPDPRQTRPRCAAGLATDPDVFAGLFLLNAAEAHADRCTPRKRGLARASSPAARLVQQCPHRAFLLQTPHARPAKQQRMRDPRSSRAEPRPVKQR